MINILSHYELLPVLIRALPPDTSASLLQDKNSLLSSVSSVHCEDPAVSSLSKWSNGTCISSHDMKKLVRTGKNILDSIAVPLFTNSETAAATL